MFFAKNSLSFVNKKSFIDAPSVFEAENKIVFTFASTTCSFSNWSLIVSVGREPPTVKEFANALNPKKTVNRNFFIIFYPWL